MAATLLHDLVFGLSAEASRAAAAIQLSSYLNAEEALLFALDPVAGVLVPAAGMPQTVRGGRVWRAFLAKLIEDGEYVGHVDLPPAALRPAIAWVTHGAALVLLGGSPDAVRCQELRPLLPLLASTLQVEQQLLVAKSEAISAAAAAIQASTLSSALETARSEASHLNAQLRSEDLAKDEFLATLAHELRNPLAGIYTSVAVLKRVGAADALKSRALDALDRQSRQLARLVDDLLDAARIRHGHVTLQLEAVELRSALAEAVEFNRHAVDAKGHQVEMQVCGEPLVVMGDPARLLQVFTNLFLNACKYTPAGGGITLSGRRVGTWAEVAISDTGIGLDSKMMSRVFDLFTQSPAALKQAQGGLGIGLSLVKKLVNLHGGTVDARSPGKDLGSTFTVRIPLADPVAPEAQ